MYVFFYNHTLCVFRFPSSLIMMHHTMHVVDAPGSAD